MPIYTGNLSGAWIPIVVSGTNKKIDAGILSSSGANLATAALTATGYYAHDWNNYPLEIHNLTNINLGFWNPVGVDEINYIYPGAYKSFLLGRQNEIGGATKDNYIIGTKNLMYSAGNSQFTYMWGDENYCDGNDNTKNYYFGSGNIMSGNANRHNLIFGFKSYLQQGNISNIIFETDGDGANSIYSINSAQSSFIAGSRNFISGITHSNVIGFKNQLTINDNQLFVFGEENTHYSGNPTVHSYLIGRENNIYDGTSIYMIGKANTMHPYSYANNLMMVGEHNKIMDGVNSTNSYLFGKSNRITGDGTYQFAFGFNNYINGNYSFALGYKQSPNANEMRVGISPINYIDLTPSDISINSLSSTFNIQAANNTGYTDILHLSTENLWTDRTQYVADADGTPCFSINGTTADYTGNINLASAFATVATSGAYSDLTGTPTIPAAQINSDWNASSGLAQILNKPNIDYLLPSQLGNSGKYLVTNGSNANWATVSSGIATISNNNYVGYNSGYGGTGTSAGSGPENILVGMQSGSTITTGYSNVALGTYSLHNTTTGYTNVAIGSSALSSSTTGYGNTGIGYQTLNSVTSGNNNIGYGYGAGSNITTGSNNTVLGYMSFVPNATANNQLTISNIIYGTGLGAIYGTVSTGNIGIGVQAPLSRLDVNGVNGYNQLRLETSYTPTSSSDTHGNIGDVAWDTNYIYIKTSAGWKRTATLNTF